MKKIVVFFIFSFFMLNLYAATNYVGMELLLPDNHKVKCCVSENREVKISNDKFIYTVRVIFDENGKPIDIFVVKAAKNGKDTERESNDIILVKFLGKAKKISDIPGFERFPKEQIDGDHCCLNCNGWIVCGCAVECNGNKCCVEPCCGIL